MNSIIISLIMASAPYFNIDPQLAVSVAKTESSLNPDAIGPFNEVGLFQVRPEYSKFSAEELRNPVINISEGLRILSEAKKRCKHKVAKTFIVCFNRGVTGGARVENPHKDKYYIKVMERLNG